MRTIARMMHQFYDNTELQRYFEAKVVPQQEETRRIISVLKPDLEKLFQCINKRDPRLYQQVSHVGSYYQGLKVRRSDEFDYTLFIDIKQQWCVVHEFDGVYYGFKGCDSELEHKAHTISLDRGDGVPTNLHKTMNEKMQIEQKGRPLVHPGEGYYTASLSEENLKVFHDMSFDGDLVPWFVKMKLKQVLTETLKLPEWLEFLELPKYFKGERAKASNFLNNRSFLFFYILGPFNITFYRASHACAVYAMVVCLCVSVCVCLFVTSRCFTEHANNAVR